MSDRAEGGAERDHRELAVRGSSAPDLLRRGVTASRRADSRVIEVAVALDDRGLAQAACNLVLSTYTDGGGGGAGAEEAYQRNLAQLSETELSSSRMRNDVRILDTCRTTSR